MKPLGISVGVLVVLSVIGCGSGKDTSITVTGDNGEKTTMKTSGDGTNVTVTGTDTNGDKVTMSTEKNGGMKVEGSKTNASIGGDTEVTEADLGVPFYPGSTAKAGSASKIETDDEKGYICARETTDDPAKVMEFYKDKVKKSTTMSSGDMSSVSGTEDSGATIAIVSQKQGGKTDISYTYSLKKKK